MAKEIKPNTQKTPPEHIRVGAISVSVWTNESEKGDYKTVSLQRSYKVGEEWKNTTTLRVNDIPRAILGLQKAFEKLAIKDSQEEE